MVWTSFRFSIAVTHNPNVQSDHAYTRKRFMPYSFKQRAKTAAISFLATWFARLWFATVRISIVNRDVYDRHFRQIGIPHHVVGASWHRNAIFLFYFFRNLGDRLIMISRSLDGEITAGVARRFGYTPVRGSSSRGGSEALQQMIDVMNGGQKKYLCGTAVDGPRGPARKLKKGMVAVAMQTGALFVPMACSGNRLITFPRAWDKTIIPKPFSRMTIAFGEPVAIPAGLLGNDLETLCRKLEDDLNRLTDTVDQTCGYRDAEMRRSGN